MNGSKTFFATIALGLLTIGELVSLYQVAFDIWMTAYPFADASAWRTRLCIRIAQTVVIGLIWTGLLTWLIKYKSIKKIGKR